MQKQTMGYRAMQRSVYAQVLARKVPPAVLDIKIPEAEFNIRDCLEDMAFRDWLEESVTDTHITVKTADMLLIPSLSALVTDWVKQSEDYKWAISEFPGFVDRLATIGLALEYNPESGEVTG